MPVAHLLLKHLHNDNHAPLIPFPSMTQIRSLSPSFAFLDSFFLIFPENTVFINLKVQKEEEEEKICQKITKA